METSMIFAYQWRSQRCLQRNLIKVFKLEDFKKSSILVDFFANFQTELQFKTFISRLI